jgi:chitodextrinase
MNHIENARKLRTIIEQAAQSLPDETALEAVELYPKWESGVFYDAGLKVRYEDVLYTVLTAHMTQSDWTPDAAPSLFAKVLIPDPGVIPAWEQPDSTNAYSKGDKVTHNGKTWVSEVDNNVWEPGVYGWDEI